MCLRWPSRMLSQATTTQHTKRLMKVHSWRWKSLKGQAVPSDFSLPMSQALASRQIFSRQIRSLSSVTDLTSRQRQSRLVTSIGVRKTLWYHTISSHSQLGRVRSLLGSSLSPPGTCVRSVTCHRVPKAFTSSSRHAGSKKLKSSLGTGRVTSSTMGWRTAACTRGSKGKTLSRTDQPPTTMANWRFKSRQRRSSQAIR